MNLIIDIGNTRTKLALVQLHEVLEIFTYPTQKPDFDAIFQFLKKHSFSNAIISSVAQDIPEPLLNHISYLNPIILNKNLMIPVGIAYHSPETLGNDRIALAVAGNELFPNQNVLIIDAGTCITYDFVNRQNIYLGGAISPGIEIRFKALHTFTQKLPLVENTQSFELIGKTTKDSILSGVLNGVLSEIDGIIEQYQLKYENLKIILSGGDTNFLAKNLKNNIFAFSNLLLLGLNSILTYNVKK